jgi:hypothetical protein
MTAWTAKLFLNISDFRLNRASELIARGGDFFGYFSRAAIYLVGERVKAQRYFVVGTCRAKRRISKTCIQMPRNTVTSDLSPPMDESPYTFVKVVKGDLCNNLHGGNRARDANFPRDEQADYESIDRSGSAPAHRFYE